MRRARGSTVVSMVAESSFTPSVMSCCFGGSEVWTVVEREGEGDWLGKRRGNEGLSVFVYMPRCLCLCVCALLPSVYVHVCVCRMFVF